MRTLTEESHLDYSNDNELSYYDDGCLTTVSLFVGEDYVGDIEVWKDSEMSGREYICINYEIKYLDSIKKLS